jgi:hypothetical protein
MLHQYHAYSVGIHSSLRLPELVPLAGVNEDINIRVEDPSSVKAQNGLAGTVPYAISESTVMLNFSKVGMFRINEGREIIIHPLPNIEERLLRLPLLGAAMAVVLSQRGKCVLHSSAVAVGNDAIAFIGNKGYGKSTTAAMICKRGHQLLADDVVAINGNVENQHMVLPGIPQFKLYPDSVMAAFNEDPETLEEIAANVDKRSRRADVFCGHARRLRAIYVLNYGKALRIHRLQPQHAITSLIANSYMARFNSGWMNSGMAGPNLRQCSALANDVPVFLLERPADLGALDSMAASVEQHIATV